MKGNTSTVNFTSLICATACAAFSAITRIVSGSPFDTVHKLDTCDMIPPMWIFNLLSVIWAFIIGLAAGGIVTAVSSGRCGGASQISAYRGGLFFISSFFLGIIWYPTFFCSQSLLISLLLALCALICNVVCAFNWYNLPVAAPPLIMSAYVLWLFYIVFMNISVFMHN